MPVELSGPAAARVELIKRIGAGSFGDVYRATDKETKQEVAVKVEELKSKAPQLTFEYDMSKKLAEGVPNPQGFALPQLLFDNVGKHRILVMPMLGYCLEDVMQKCGGKLGVKSTLMIIEQILRRLEYLHSLRFVHRDIKPENFMLGRGPTEHHVYLIDFGLSKAYHDGEKHRPIRQGCSLTGTVRYASINVHKGCQQSRRDDIEASGYMIMYFLRGAMPWSGLAAKTQKEKYARIAEVKEKTSLDELCAGFPPCFKEFIATARTLEYAQKPNYAAYRKNFRDAFDAAGYVEDYHFDWCKAKPANLEPIGEWSCAPQPDETKEQQKADLKASGLVVGDACDKANARRSKMSEELLRIKKAFDNWDVNNDGGIDQEEFKKVLMTIGIATQEIDSMFEAADANKDGKIVYEEFINWMQKDIPPEVREEVYALHGDDKEEEGLHPLPVQEDSGPATSSVPVHVMDKE